MKEKSIKTFYVQCEVVGYWDGEIEARSEAEAKELARDEMHYENLVPNGPISVETFEED